ncbi:MAG: nicotinate (nicotinamide) nucleotide adenylyltransferase [Vicinamibacteria bacterium]|nr:nicotinate (nicotinamide) nucleotide adenylyltransferase [Vicinamibacteria bacterium]
MKIGVMGGSFDPIHLGHLRAAEMAREALEISRVLFVPVGRPPHRSLPLGSDLDRFAMVCLAIQGHERFQASDVELVRAGPSYTIETVSILSRRHSDATLILIVGSDAFAEVRAWKDFDHLVSLCRVAVVSRPDSEMEEVAPTASWFLPVPGEGLPISSTMVRTSLKEGRSIRYLVPDPVAAHIEKRGLYR